MGEGEHRVCSPTNCSELNDLRESLSELQAKIVSLEERFLVAERSRSYLKKALEESRKLTQDAASSLERIGGHILHEEHHRVVDKIQKDREVRASIYNKVLGDVFSKTTIGLITTFIALCGYIGTKLGIWG